MDYKHLTLDERIAIKIGIDNGLSLKKIATQIGRDPRGVSREIRNYRSDYTKYNLKHTSKSCVFRRDCLLIQRAKNQWQPFPCNTCKDYVEITCPKMNKFPYVCGKCIKKPTCACSRYEYNPVEADKRAKEVLSSSRIGSSISQEELDYLSNVLKEKLKKGIPLYHIYESDQKLQRICSLNYIYALLHKGHLDLDCLDFRRIVRYSRRRAKSNRALERSIRIGRTYIDYCCEKEKYPIHIQMDTVIGQRSSSKVLLTMLIVETNLMFAKLLDDKTCKSVLNAFNELENVLGLEDFKKIFSCVLTDNGSEFYCVEELEISPISNAKRSNIFFCDPRMSQQKGAIEKNHEFIRYIFPQGTSFDEFTQDNIDLMMSHINALKRPKFKASPYELTVNLLGEKIVKKLGVEFVPANDITFSPKFFK